MSKRVSGYTFKNKYDISHFWNWWCRNIVMTTIFQKISTSYLLLDHGCIVLKVEQSITISPVKTISPAKDLTINNIK